MDDHSYVGSLALARLSYGGPKFFSLVLPEDLVN